MHKLIIVLLAVFCFTACEKDLIKEEFSNTPKGVYDAFWSEYDQFYGAFEAKGINWDSLGVVCGSDINSGSTQKQLYDALCKLLASLNDGHASLSAPQYGVFRSWSRRNKSFFTDIVSVDGNMVNEIYTRTIYSYIGNYFKKDLSKGYLFLYGRIYTNRHVIGYLYIPTFAEGYFPAKFIREAASDFNNADAVIIDVRFNGGGTSENFLYALNLFSTERQLYLKSKLRNGKSHTDFTGLYDHYTSPVADGCKNKPIAILANSYTASSSEHFILGLKSQPNVILVGDTTCGAFSEVHEKILPNGWVYRLGAQVVYTPGGKLYTNSKGQYIEGNGIAPDYYMGDYYEEIQYDNDMPLNRALQEIDKLVKK
jgi:carboxyl-terminal processing protease